MTHWKRLWCCEGLGAGGEEDDRGWDGWMASLIRWTWIWVNSGSWWWTGRPGMLRFMGSQRVGHDWATELNWTELMIMSVRWDLSVVLICIPPIISNDDSSSHVLIDHMNVIFGEMFIQVLCPFFNLVIWFFFFFCHWVVVLPIFWILTLVTFIILKYFLLQVASSFYW